MFRKKFKKLTVRPLSVLKHSAVPSCVKADEVLLLGFWILLHVVLDQLLKDFESDANERAARRKRSEADAEKLKAKGNLAFKGGRYEEAIEYYTEAIKLVKYLTALYTNRAQVGPIIQLCMKHTNFIICRFITEVLFCKVLLYLCSIAYLSSLIIQKRFLSHSQGSGLRSKHVHVIIYSKLQDHIDLSL